MSESTVTAEQFREIAAAIEREVSVLTDLPQDVRDFTQTIARIKADKEKTLEGDYKSGYERGVDYGRTDAYFDYNFTFDADRYPPGLASYYPSRVSVSYSIRLIIENNYITLPAANIIFSLEIINSSGPPIEIFSQTYQTSGTFGWYARTKNMPSEDISSTFTATQNMTLRFHFVFHNYNAAIYLNLEFQIKADLNK